MSEADIEMLIEAEPFAKGTARHAYRTKSDPNAIVKKSIQPRNYSNFLEWTIWLGSEPHRSEEHTSELQTLMRSSYAVVCLKKTKQKRTKQDSTPEKQTTTLTYT